MDSRAFSSHPCVATLLGRFYYCWPPRFTAVRAQSGCRFSSLQTARLASPSWKMRGPCNGAGSFENRIGLCEPNCPLTCGKTVSFQGLDQLLAVCCNRRELESLIGHLHHAAKVVWPGRTFLRRMIDLLCWFRKRDHPICLNKEFHLDLCWWHQFLFQWHGVSFRLFPGLSPEADEEVSSDAAGSLGYGAFLKDCWFAGPWAPSQQQQSIAYKELFPVVITAHVWGHHCCRKHVLFHSDNDAVVHILNSRMSKVPGLMRLFHSLLFAAACHCFSFSAQHVPGVTNQIADAPSHFRWQEFRRLAPHAQLHPTPIPSDLLTDLTFSFLTHGFCTIDSAFLCISPNKVHLLLQSAGQVAPIRVSMPNR